MTAFGRYDMPGATMDGDVNVLGDVRVAWFKRLHRGHPGPRESLTGVNRRR